MREKEQESGWWQFVALAVASFIVFAFILPNHPGIGGAICVCVIGEFFAAKACWDRRPHPWFWITLAAMAFVQGAIIILVPWPQTRFPGMVLLPIGLVDFAVVHAVIRFVERLSIQKG